MKYAPFILALSFLASAASAQGGGSGAPSPVSQTDTPQAASAAEKAIAARHDRAVQRSKAHEAKRAAKAASATN